ncbi:hypothetical protein RCL_jg7557.t2 [Rhizophagus clarus]|uniref:Uncharacterized protein n=1 Tax=Rhizophagus clarus TaxID=94130 RepID=A0A8H3KW17_9GLOM|nr:hypothetical protein RCL_jg7557.t2 [Rhizophagus clarus]
MRIIESLIDFSISEKLAYLRENGARALIKEEVRNQIPETKFSDDSLRERGRKVLRLLLISRKATGKKGHNFCSINTKRQGIPNRQIAKSWNNGRSQSRKWNFRSGSFISKGDQREEDNGKSKRRKVDGIFHLMNMWMMM